MADYQITAPDGLQHTVSAPDGADSDSILGFAKTVLDNAKQGISNAWDKTEPARVQVGALMSGDPQTALDSLKGQIAGVTKQDVYDAMSGMGVDAAGGGGLVGATAWHGSPRLFDTIGLENRGRDLIQSKAEEYAQKLRDAGVNVLDVQHSGSLAGPSSYIKIHGQPDLRISGHDKGVAGSQSVVNIGSDEQFNEILSQLPKTVRQATPEDYARIEQQKIENDYPRWLASADKKLSKGKGLTNSEQEAVTWRNGQPTGQKPWDSSNGTPLSDLMKSKK